MCSTKICKNSKQSSQPLTVSLFPALIRARSSAVHLDFPILRRLRQEGGQEFHSRLANTVRPLFQKTKTYVQGTLAILYSLSPTLLHFLLGTSDNHLTNHTHTHHTYSHLFWRQGLTT